MPASRPPVPALRRVLRTVLLAALAVVMGWWTLAFLLQRSFLREVGVLR